MRLGTSKEAWGDYILLLGEQIALPPESIFVMSGDELVAGACIYPAGPMMVVSGVLGTPAGLRFLLNVVRGHQMVTDRTAILQMHTKVDLEAMSLSQSPFLLLGDEVEALEPPKKEPSKPRARVSRKAKKKSRQKDAGSCTGWSSTPRRL